MALSRMCHENVRHSILPYPSHKHSANCAAGQTPAQVLDRVHPAIINFARREIGAMSGLPKQAEILELLGRDKHTTKEMQLVGQALRGLGLTPQTRIPNVVEDAIYYDQVDLLAPQYQVLLKARIRSRLPADQLWDSLADVWLRQAARSQFKGTPAHHMASYMEDLVKIFDVKGVEAGRRHMQQQYGDPRDAHKGKLGAEAGPAELLEADKMALRKHYGEHIIDAMVTDNMISTADYIHHLRPMEFEQYVTLAEKAKKDDAKAADKEAYRHLIETYENMSLHPAYYDRSSHDVFDAIQAVINKNNPYAWKQEKPEGTRMIIE